MRGPRAGQPARPSDLVDVPALVTAYYALEPDPADPAQQVVFGTSGHRGSSLDAAFNEAHILATTQAICEYRAAQGYDGPLFIGRDTHALSDPAWTSALEVLVANDVTVLVDAADRYTPTPAVSHAILRANRGKSSGLADGIVVTPSHNDTATTEIYTLSLQTLFDLGGRRIIYRDGERSRRWGRRGRGRGARRPPGA